MVVSEDRLDVPAMLELVSACHETLLECTVEQIVEIERAVGLDNTGVLDTMPLEIRVPAMLTYIIEHNLFEKFLEVLGARAEVEYG